MADDLNFRVAKARSDALEELRDDRVQLDMLNLEINKSLVAALANGATTTEVGEILGISPEAVEARWEGRGIRS